MKWTFFPSRHWRRVRKKHVNSRLIWSPIGYSTKKNVCKPAVQEGVSLKENCAPLTHVIVLSPVSLYPGLHFRDTSLPAGTGNCASVVIFSQVDGKLSQGAWRESFQIYHLLPLVRYWKNVGPGPASKQMLPSKIVVY